MCFKFGKAPIKSNGKFAMCAQQIKQLGIVKWSHKIINKCLDFALRPILCLECSTETVLLVVRLLSLTFYFTVFFFFF